MEFKFRLSFWPILTLLWMILTFIVSYIVAVIDDHVYPAFPFISDTGTQPPESCIFGEMLNIGVLMELLTMFIRYRVVQLLEHRGGPKSYRRWNNCSCFFGIVSCFGISMVANFQESSVKIAHFAGAFLAFVFGGIYCLIQTYLTWLTPISRKLKVLRLFLSSTILPLFGVMLTCSYISRQMFKGNKLKWKRDNVGYGLHLIATVTEWLMAIAINSFVVTFVAEFKQVEFKGISFLRS